MKGAAEMVAKIREVATSYPQRIAAALYTEAELIMTESKKRCPVAPDGGILRASGQVHEPEIKQSNVYQPAKISVLMSYGGAAEAYAIAVHEHLSEHSPPSWWKAEAAGKGIHWTTPGTGPKFLEQPINEAESQLLLRIAARLHLG